MRHSITSMLPPYARRRDVGIAIEPFERTVVTSKSANSLAARWDVPRSAHRAAQLFAEIEVPSQRSYGATSTDADSESDQCCQYGSWLGLQAQRTEEAFKCTAVLTDEFDDGFSSAPRSVAKLYDYHFHADRFATRRGY